MMTSLIVTKPQIWSVATVHPPHICGIQMKQGKLGEWLITPTGEVEPPVLY